MNIENKKQFATILLALGLGLIAAVLTSTYVKTAIQQQSKLYKEEFEKKTVGPLIGELERMNVEYKKLRQQQELLASAQKDIPRLVQQMAAVSQRDLKDTGPKKPIVDSTQFSYVTPAGKRALTIMIDSLSAVGGLINPGDFVDVLGALNVPKSLDDEETDTNTITTVLFQNIQVLAINANFKPLASSLTYQTQQQSRSLNVTLAVTPEEAGLLTFAQSNGKLQLALRPPQEQGTYSLQVASWGTLSDFVLDHQGTELLVPLSKPVIKASEGIKKSRQEAEVSIEIFEGGREL